MGARRVASRLFGVLGVGLLIASAGVAATRAFDEQEPPVVAQPARKTRSGSPVRNWAASPLPAPSIDQPLVMNPVRTAALHVDAGRPTRVQIARVGIDAPVVEVDVLGGAYAVPARAAGHHVDSVAPGLPGRAAINGHLESLNAGRVFARLGEVQPDDEITVWGETVVTVWAVRSVTRHDRSDRDWLIGEVDPTLVLYTCAGAFDWRTMDYQERLVVYAELVSSRSLAG